MLQKSDPLLCDFTEKQNDRTQKTGLKMQEAALDYPFRYEMEKKKLNPTTIPGTVCASTAELNKKGEYKWNSSTFNPRYPVW